MSYTYLFIMYVKYVNENKLKKKKNQNKILSTENKTNGQTASLFHYVYYVFFCKYSIHFIFKR